MHKNKMDNFGVRGRAHTWITNFLTERKQRPVADDNHSQWVQVRSGVPQGTVLGPLKGVLHPRPVFGLFLHFSQKLQYIGDK